VGHANIHCFLLHIKIRSVQHRIGILHLALYQRCKLFSQTLEAWDSEELGVLVGVTRERALAA
jgi:hypothetical protein